MRNSGENWTFFQHLILQVNITFDMLTLTSQTYCCINGLGLMSTFSFYEKNMQCFSLLIIWNKAWKGFIFFIPYGFWYLFLITLYFIYSFFIPYFYVIISYHFYFLFVIFWTIYFLLLCPKNSPYHKRTSLCSWCEHLFSLHWPIITVIS